MDQDKKERERARRENRLLLSNYLPIIIKHEIISSTSEIETKI